MPTYEEQKTAISRTPCALLTITMDYCTLTFGSSPCTATGTKCYNTYPTCKDKANYDKGSKDYKITSSATPIPFLGSYPYLNDANILPTEIKDNKTIHARGKFKLLDEPGTDVGIDPYLSDRSSVQGTFWKKFVARNPNYKGRRIKYEEGFIGIAEGEFNEKFVGAIDNIKLGIGEIEIEAKDLLKKLDDIKVAEKIDCKLTVDIDNSQTTISISDASLVDDPASETKYVKFDDEIVSYTVRDTSTNQISGGARAQFNTTADSHDADQKVEKVRYYAADNPYDILLSILQDDADIDSADIDTTAFTNLKTDPVVDINRKAIITEPTKLSKLYFELTDELDCKSWQNEDLKITIAKNMQNKPGRSYTTLTDEANIIKGSVSVDLNDDSRISRISVYWNKTTLGDVDDKDSYSRIDISIDADAESANEYDEEQEKEFYSRWLHEGLATEEELNNYIIAIFSRQLFRQRDAQLFYKCKVELKDQDIKTGDFTKITTDDIQEIDGASITNRSFQVVRRQKKGNEIHLKLIIMPKKKIAFFAPDGTSDYSSASDAEKEYGFFANADEEMSNGDPAYHFY